MEHLARVAQRLVARWPDASAEEIDAAWLHDVLEDTAITAEQLRAAGISGRTIEIVQRLTRPAGVAYLGWIAELAASGDVGAIRVKLADNEDNSDPDRVAALVGGADLVESRYRPARTILERTLAQATK